MRGMKMKIRKLGIILLATIITVTNMVVYANSADDSIIHSSDDVIKEYTKNKEMEKTKRSIQKVRHQKQNPSRPKKKNSSPHQLYLFHRKLRHRKLCHRRLHHQKLHHQKQYRLK